MSFGTRVARVRKAIAAGLGLLITLILLVPEDMIPDKYRPYVGLVLMAGTVTGVYKVRNASPTRDELAAKVRPPRSPQH